MSVRLSVWVHDLYGKVTLGVASCLSFHGGDSVQLAAIWGQILCQLSRVKRMSVSWRLETHYIYAKFNQGHVVRPLYGGRLYLGRSVMGGSTVIIHVSSGNIYYLSMNKISLCC